MGPQRVRAAVLKTADHADQDGIFAGAVLTFNVWNTEVGSFAKYEAFLTVTTMIDLRRQIDEVLAHLEQGRSR